MKGSQCHAVIVALVLAISAGAQSVNYPKEIRGYKVERAAVEMKSRANPDSSKDGSDDVDQLISFSTPELARATPLGITFDVPIVVAPVKQSGHVHFLIF